MEIDHKTNSNSSPLILLTGCINPDGMAYTKLQNPETRKAQYLEAIRFYLAETTNNILFVENSGTDISSEFNDTEHKERLEFLTFSGNDYDKQLGKGHGEMLILKYAIAQSSIVYKSDFICKITGRYKILNIRQILTHFTNCDCDLMVDLLSQMKYSDSRIFIAKKSFFEEYLFMLPKQVDDSNGYYFEHALKDAVLYAIIKDSNYLPFKYRPRIVGKSGTDNLDYNHSFWDWIRMYKKQKDYFKYFTAPPNNY